MPNRKTGWDFNQGKQIKHSTCKTLQKDRVRNRHVSEPGTVIGLLPGWPGAGVWPVNCDWLAVTEQTKLSHKENV